MKDRRPILEALNDMAPLRAEKELPAQERLDSIRRVVTASLRPVRPLPSTAALVSLALAGFTALSLLLTFQLGFIGYHRLSANQRLAYYAVILFSAALLLLSLVKDIIPGSKRYLPPALVPILSLVSVLLVVCWLFPTLDFTQFVYLGLGCLEHGILYAAISGILAYWMVRSGFSTSPLRTATTAGLAAGLVGFAVLALHCPLHNVAHILVWHFGAVLIAGAAGALIGLLPRRSATASE